ncbi:hypothetical protein BYT27DRAFT_7186756 [Phlegmacium glaucopus]|nr:hypothetical protein BYT27DRAFT_7186756 [Phlegmacium glaucopus]
MLNNIIRDYRLLSEYRIRFPIVIYFISKLSTLAFALCCTIFQTTPLSTCEALEHVLDAFFVLSITSSSLLLFFRIRAIFDRNPWVVTLFSGLWLAIVAASVTYLVMIAVHKVEAAGRESCVVIGNVAGYSAAASIVPLINDTLVFFAISWRLFRNSYARRTRREGVRFPNFRDYLPVFYKAFLQDGQAYYVVIVTVNVLTVIMFFDQSIPDSLRTVFMVPNVVLTNIMACRVFRNTIFGSVRESQISTSFVAREPNVDSVIPLAVLREEGSSDSSTKQAGGATFKIDGIAVTQTVERKHDYGAQ